MIFQYLNIVHYYGYFESNNDKYFLIEFINGETLKKYDIKKLKINEKIKIINKLLYAIESIHSKNGIYRDFNLNNIMINDNKKPFLIDFDRVVNVSEQSTFDFASESVAPDSHFTEKSDVFSL